MSVDDSEHLENSGPNSQEEREVEFRWLPSVVLVSHHWCEWSIKVTHYHYVILDILVIFDEFGAFGLVHLFLGLEAVCILCPKIL